MILSTFHYFIQYRLHCMALFVICTATFNILSQRLTAEIIPGSVMPDTAFAGYSPEQSRDWYLRLKKDERRIVLVLGLLDCFGIMPAYVLGCGAQLLRAGCPGLLSYLPIWVASFDLIESMTTVCAIAAMQYDMAWAPSSLHLVLASTATQFKGAFFVVCILMMGWFSMPYRAKKKVP
jgi:hypothetical protein